MGLLGLQMGLLGLQMGLQGTLENLQNSGYLYTTGPIEMELLGLQKINKGGTYHADHRLQLCSLLQQETNPRG
jgi:hypothetical protein